MSNKFEVELGTTKKIEGVFTFREAVHASLDSLLDEFKGVAHVFGGSVMVDTRSLDGRNLQFKLSFVDVTGRKDCPFCDGTGLDEG